MPWIAHAPTPPFCGYSSFEAQADGALVVCVTRANLSFSRLCSQTFPSNNLERELGGAFSPPQFTVRESEVSDEDFFCVCVNIRRWQAAPSCFFCFFFCFWKVFPWSEWVWHVCPILLSFDIFFPEPFHKSTCHGLKMGVPWPHCRWAIGYTSWNRASQVLRPGQRNVYRSAKSRRKRWSKP